jgi:hypothetical protein
VCPAICLFILPRAPLFLLLHDAINRPYYFLTFFLALLLLITFASHCPYEVSIPQAKKNLMHPSRFAPVGPSPPRHHGRNVPLRTLPRVTGAELIPWCLHIPYVSYSPLSVLYLVPSSTHLRTYAPTHLPEGPSASSPPASLPRQSTMRDKTANLPSSLGPARHPRIPSSSTDLRSM